MTQDYYQILGVPRNATMDEIKKAYRSLANKHHPDKGGDGEVFQEINIAYSILSDPSRRQVYDNPQPQDNFFTWQGANNPEDIFAHFAAGGHAGAFNPFDIFNRRQAAPKNRTINLQTNVSLLDAFTGKELIFEITLPSGRPQHVNVKVPVGIQDGIVLRLTGLGDDSIPNVPRGDIHLTVNVTPHHEFTRQGDDLIKEIPIHCIDAITGCKITVITIDGKELEVNVNPGIQHGQTLNVAGYGMPNMNDPRFRGRLLLPVKIEIPTVFSEGQRQMLEKFHSL
jgi:DnaJ-class molecular chaperone